MTKKLLVTGLALVLMAGFAQAATLALQGNVTAAFSADGNWTPIDLASVPANTPAIYQVDYSFTLSDLAAGQASFGNLAMDLTLNNLTDAESIGWGAYNTTWGYKVGPSNKTANVFSDTGDWGVAGDLKGIVAGIDPMTPTLGLYATDPRVTLGQGTPAPLGTMYVVWDGVTPASIQATLTGFSTVNTSGVMSTDLTGSKVGATVEFGTVPEPVTMSLLAIGGLAALIRRRK